MNLIKNIRPKQILENFKNFDYLEYLNIDENKPKTSISSDFSKDFVDKNKSFDKLFVTKMKLFWRLQFLGFFAIIAILTTFITLSAVIYWHWYFLPYIFISTGLVISSSILFYYNLYCLPKTILNRITSRVENFKTFELLFKENQFKNFNETNGPYEFQIVLLLNGNVNMMGLASNGTMNRFKDNRPNIISCMYLITKMLIYYFEEQNNK